MIARIMNDIAEGIEAGAGATGETPAGPVLVVGGAGYIGSHCVRMLEERGVPVVVFDNLSSGHREALGAPLEVADLADRTALDAVF